MSFKVYLLNTYGISEERFDEAAELACKIKDSGVPICKALGDSGLFELFVSYVGANMEGRMTDES